MTEPEQSAHRRGFLDGFYDRPAPALHPSLHASYTTGRAIGLARSGRVVARAGVVWSVWALRVTGGGR